MLSHWHSEQLLATPSTLHQRGRKHFYKAAHVSHRLELLCNQMWVFHRKKHWLIIHFFFFSKFEWCVNIAHFGNSETFPRSYDSKLWAQYLQLNTTTFMFIDLSKTVFFFLSSLTVHLPAYCHSISVCLVITWEICVPVSTVLLIRFRLGIAGSLAMKGRIWGMWPMQVSLDAVL